MSGAKKRFRGTVTATVLALCVLAVEVSWGALAFSAMAVGEIQIAAGFTAGLWFLALAFAVGAWIESLLEKRQGGEGGA